MGKFIAIFSLTAVLFASTAKTDDTVYPSGSSIQSTYDLSADTTYLGDTLTISRTLTNNESFDLTGLFFTENLPDSYSLISYSILLNDSPITVDLDSSRNVLYTDYLCCHFIVDDPDNSVTNTLSPGDSVSLILKILCNSLGENPLPMHAAVFEGNSSGYFTTSDTLYHFVVSAPDTIPPSDINDLLAE